MLVVLNLVGDFHWTFSSRLLNVYLLSSRFSERESRSSLVGARDFMTSVEVAFSWRSSCVPDCYHLHGVLPQNEIWTRRAGEERAAPTIRKTHELSMPMRQTLTPSFSGSWERREVACVSVVALPHSPTAGFTHESTLHTLLPRA